MFRYSWNDFVGAQLEHREVVLNDARREAGRRRTERRGEVALGIDVDGEDALAGLRSEQRERSGDRGPAGAALARDEDDPPPEQRCEIDPLTGDRAPNRR